MNQDPNNCGGKVCKQCRVMKPACDYYALKTGKLGLTSRCKSCTAANSKAIRDADPETARLKSKLRNQSWNAHNPEKLRARLKRYAQKHPERVKAYKDKWADKNPSYVKEFQKRRRVKLSDTYVRSVLCNHCSLSFADIPQDLVELQRAYLKLHRSLKNNQP